MTASVQRAPAEATTTAARSRADRHVVVIGAGGNIGSHVVPHLARTAAVGRLTLIDRDRYEERNVANQGITATSIGRPKAMVQARVAQRINPQLEIRAIAEDVEAVPLGVLRADVILACLDSRRSRQYVNQAASRLGVPWIDAGVLADGLLARIDTYFPGPDQPCLECGWDAHDYAAIEQTYPCANGELHAPTGAPAGLGALAAALQALECAKLLRGDAPAASQTHGEQVVIGVVDRRHYHTRRVRNPACRLVPHDAWTIEPLALDFGTATLRTLFAAVADRTGTRNGSAIRIEGKSFVREASCSSCGTVRRKLRIATAAGTRLGNCHRCGGQLVAAGFALNERLEAASVSAAELQRSLRGTGIRPHEVITAGSSALELHVELLDHCPTNQITSATHDRVGAAS